MQESDFQTNDIIRDADGDVFKCYRPISVSLVLTVWFEFGNERETLWSGLAQPVQRVYLTTDPPPREAPEGMTLYERTKYGWYWSCEWVGCKAWTKDSDPMHDPDWCIDNAYGHAEQYHKEGQ